MKTNIFRLLFALSITIIAISSCRKEDNSFDYEEALREQQRLDSLDQVRIAKLMEEQAPELKAFVDEHMPGAELNDSTGIWYKIHDAGIEDSFRYRLMVMPGGGLGISPQYTEVKYTGRLLDEARTIFDGTEDDETEVFELGRLIPAWPLTLWPTELEYNLRDFFIGGFTAQGLKKGAVVEIVTPSPHAYDQREIVEEGEVIIPANSPLYFHIEIVDARDQE